MKNATIQQALDLGFDFDQFTDHATIEEINVSLIEFFNESSDKLPQEEDECEVTSSGRSQNVTHENFSSSGEIVDFSLNWHKSPDTKVFHSSYIFCDKNGIYKNMNLYYLVGETDYNAPEGYFFDRKLSKHVAFDNE